MQKALAIFLLVVVVFRKRQVGILIVRPEEMITFDLQARAGLINASAYAMDVCRALADALFPFEF